MESFLSIATELEVDENIPHNNQDLTKFMRNDYQRSPDRSSRSSKLPLTGSFESLSTSIEFKEPDLRDIEYGEPFRAQKLMLDFTPVPGVDDNKELETKCIEFWDFINSHSEINYLRVLPTPMLFSEDSTITSTPSSYTSSSQGSSIDTEDEKSVVGWIEDMKLDAISKLPKKYCSHGRGEYIIGRKRDTKVAGDELKRTSKMNAATLVKPGCQKSCTSVCSSHKLGKKHLEDTQQLYQMMEEFDKKNPKSMKPPGHAPPLTSAVLQRCPNRVIIIPDAGAGILDEKMLSSFLNVIQVRFDDWPLSRILEDESVALRFKVMPPDMALNMRHSKLKAAEAALLAGELKKPTWESRNEGIHERVSFEDSIWGFDLAGGAYYKTPLRVVAVKRDSRADKAGIRVGDKLTRINDIDTSTLTIQEAHTMIIDSGVHLRIAVSAPEDEEDSYHCYEDPIDEAYDSEEERLREEEEARRRQVHAKVSSYWSLQWPWVSKRRVIYRESNCFMVPSKYEKSHSEKFSPQQSVITQDDIVLQSTKSEKEMKNVINNESEQTNKPLVNGHELPTLNGNGHIQNGDQPQQSIPNGNLDNKKLISNGHVNNLNDLVGIPEDEESMQDEGNVEIVSQNNEMVVADDEVNNESLKYNNEVAQTIDENFSSQLDGMTEADDDMMIINELLDDNNDDMHKIDEDITPQMNGMTEADDGIINEVLEKNNGTVHENKEDVSFQVNRSIGTDNEVINDIENNHEVSNEVDEDEILNSILSDNVIQNSESMEER